MKRQILCAKMHGSAGSLADLVIWDDVCRQIVSFHSGSFTIFISHPLDVVQLLPIESFTVVAYLLSFFYSLRILDYFQVHIEKSCVRNMCVVLKSWQCAHFSWIWIIFHIGSSFCLVVEVVLYVQQNNGYCDYCAIFQNIWIISCRLLWIRNTFAYLFNQIKLNEEQQSIKNMSKMSGPVETELPPHTSAFRRKEKLRLSLHNTRSINGSNTGSLTLATAGPPEPLNLKERVRSISCDELARKLSNCNNKQRLPFLLLDCRGYLCYTECHIVGAVHIACADRFNRKRVQNCSSVLDLVSTNNRRNKIVPGGGSSPSSSSSSTPGGAVGSTASSAKWRDVIVYDEGTNDLTLDSAGLQSPLSFVLMHLLQENRQPIFLNGKYREKTSMQVIYL